MTINAEEILVKALRRMGEVGISDGGMILLDQGWVPKKKDPITYIEPSRRAAKKVLDDLLARGLVTVGECYIGGVRWGGRQKIYIWLGERDVPPEPLPLVPLRFIRQK